MLEIITKNISFLLAKKRFLIYIILRYFMVKSYNLIGICLEYVFKNNKSLIDEDRFIL